MIRSYQKNKPVLGKEVFLVEIAVLAGDVTLGDRVNIWYGAVLRGDENSITVGDDSNIQDNATVHCAKEHPVSIGKHVTVGHNAIVHGCTVGDESMIGMGACVLNGAVVGKGCLIGAGAVVKEGSVIPDYSLVVGVPAKIVRSLDEETRRGIVENAELYVHLGAEYAQEEC